MEVSPRNPLKVRSLEKWKGVFKDELTMQENEDFLILKTSMCGWWYAVNAKQEDGLVPYMHLEILSADYVDYTTISMHEFKHIERTVLGWDINNVCKLVFQDQKPTTQEQNILLHTLRNLFIMCQKPEQRYVFLSKGGLDRLHAILANTFDIAIRTFCLRCLILLSPCIEARRFPAQSNLSEGILAVMKEYMDLPSFVCTCTDALSNACFQNERQRMLAAKTNCVSMLLHAMERHASIFKVQLQCSRSLANMISDPKILKQIDDNGMNTILSSLKNTFGGDAVQNSVKKQHAQDQNAKYYADHAQDNLHNSAMYDATKGQFAQQMLIILSYLNQSPRKAATFVRLDGWRSTKMIQDTIGVWDEGVRATLVGMYNTMSQNPQTAQLFFDNNFEGYQLLCDLCLESESYSLFYFQIFTMIAFIATKAKPQLLCKSICLLFERKQLGQLMATSLQQRDNERLMDSVPTITAVVTRTKDYNAKKCIFDSMVPMHLIKICSDSNAAAYPANNAQNNIQMNTPQVTDNFLNYTLVTLYHLTDQEPWVDQFVQNGAVEMCTQEWYKNPALNPNMVQNGLASLINICAKTQAKLTTQQEQGVERMYKWCTANIPALKMHAQKLERALSKAKQLKGQKKKRNARNKKGKNQMSNKPLPIAQKRPPPQNNNNNNNYNNNSGPGQQQSGGNANEYKGAVESAVVVNPYANDNGGYNQGGFAQQGSQNFNNNNNQGGGGGGGYNNNNQGSQQNFNNNNNQGGYNNNQGVNMNNPYQSQANNMQNPYKSQQNFGNNGGGGGYNNNNAPPPPNNNGNNGNNGGDQGGNYGASKWDNSSDEDDGDASSSDDSWGKEKKAKIVAQSRVNLNDDGGGNKNKGGNQGYNAQPSQPSQVNNNNQGGYGGGGAQANFNNQAQYGGAAQGSQMNFNNNQPPPPQQGGYGGGSQANFKNNQNQYGGQGSQMNFNNNQPPQGGGYNANNQAQYGGQGSQMNFNNANQPPQGGYNNNNQGQYGGQGGSQANLNNNNQAQYGGQGGGGGQNNADAWANEDYGNNPLPNENVQQGGQYGGGNNNQGQYGNNGGGNNQGQYGGNNGGGGGGNQLGVGPTGISRASVDDFLDHSSAQKERDWVGMDKRQRKDPGKPAIQQNNNNNANVNANAKPAKKKKKFKLFGK